MGRSAAPPVLREPLSVIFGARGRIAVLRVLAFSLAPLSGREIARRARLSARGAQLALGDLEVLGVITMIEGGRDRLASVNRAHVLWPTIDAAFRAEAECYSALRSAIAQAVAPTDDLVSVVLFGSTARGEEQMESDLDIAIIGRTDAAASAAVDRILAHGDALRARFGVRVAPVGWSVGAAKSGLAAKRPPFRELLSDGVLVAGRPLSESLRAP